MSHRDDLERAVGQLAQGESERFSKAEMLLAIAPNALPLDAIKPRQENTRETNAEHVAVLSQSIAHVGLVEPIVVDRDHVLIAGAHRLAAIHLLKTQDLEAFQRQFAEGIPVRILQDLRAETDPDGALVREIAENQVRKSYTSPEIRAWAKRLKMMGYRAGTGRPRRGERPLLPALKAIVGKSDRQLRRILTEGDGPQAPQVHVLVRMAAAVRKYQKQIPKADNTDSIRRAISRLLEELDEHNEVCGYSGQS